MRILLFGEYSNVHHTLSEALRRLGHEVLLVSDGDGWKDYPRDIDLRRTHPGPWGSLLYLSRLALLLPRLRGFDVVQIVNPVFLDVKPRWNRWVFDYLRRHNRCISVGCFGDDHYVIRRTQDDSLFAYTDFYAAGRRLDHAVNRHRLQAWLQGPKADLTRYVMAHAHCLMACLYEYYKVYDEPAFRDRLHYMPLPVAASVPASVPASNPVSDADTPRPTRILFAAQRKRGQMKGTDQIEPLLDRLAAAYPDQLQLTKVTSVPFAEYQRLVTEADVVIDQLYSYTPAMAALESMRQGKVVISGYEPEYARFLAQFEGSSPVVQPGIINLRPFDDEANYAELCRVLTNPKEIARLQEGSQAFVRRYHDADRVAQQCVSIWEKIFNFKFLIFNFYPPRPGVLPRGSSASP